MIKNRQNTKASLFVLLFGFVLFFIGTDGFHAYTAETARVTKLLEEKPKFTDVLLEDSNGRKYSLSEFENKYVFLTFIYTSCTTVCPQLGHNMAEIYDLIPDKYIGEDIVFLSISFDPEKDDPATLDKYKDHYHSDGETWRMARVPDQQELKALLDQLGVIVIPDDYGNFSHNAAFYLVDRDGYVVDVMDDEIVEENANKLISYLETGKGE